MAVRVQFLKSLGICDSDGATCSCTPPLGTTTGPVFIQELSEQTLRTPDKKAQFEISPYAGRVKFGVFDHHNVDVMLASAVLAAYLGHHLRKVS